ncbi:FAD-dependent monooxygenase [Bacillus sp. ISL-39]|uniref:FAD-dependent monooxygenase n=1 Tax=Bacillus sp. ISL-39 TaxID=2819124 RepID=UPI001BED02C8|nr:FAD-dependent monooxygenase [Bacillus sp. ISL-39]MBT2638896.1 FAD-dependent monooxygenase [Bacillus sp. ISL-39]
MKKINTDVCIVGSGPSGALLGLLLAKQGHEVILLEKFSNFDRDYRGEILQPSTLQLLDKINLLEYILEQPHKKIAQGGIHFKGNRIMEFKMNDISQEYPYAIQMAQSTFIQALLVEAKKHPNFKMYFNSNIKTILRDEDNHINGVSGTIEKEPNEIYANVTVGSDGRQSTIRKQTSFKATNEHHRSNLVWFTIDWPSHLPHELMYMFTGKNNLFMIPKYPDKMQIGYTFTKEQQARVKENNYQEIRSLVIEQFPELKEQVENSKQFVKLQVISLTLEHWATDGLVLVGDAAHVMTPIGVIGINVALADSIVAADVIHEALLEKDYSKYKLSEIEKKRKPEADQLQKLQIKVESLIFTTNPVVSNIRPYLVQFISKTPLVNLLMKKFFFPVNQEKKAG